MRKIINDPVNFVNDTLTGIYYAHADEVTFVDGSKKAMIKKNLKPGKVSIVTGGGSGHLPLFLGYIGDGMLDGCSVGEVFASPGVEDMLSVTKAVDAGAGVLYLYGNYGGDKMNFTMAAEQAAYESGIDVRAILGMDDVAVEIPEHRRGIAGIFFVYKCAGAAADEMLSLDEVYRVARKAADNVRTMGVSLSACTLPRVGHPSFEMEEGDMEIGMGIHGEQGVRRGRIMPADDIVDELMAKILPELELQKGSEVAVLINGLGATPLEEQYIVNKRVTEIFAEKGINVFHTYVGEYATSMEMAGLSISVLKLDDELKGYLAKPANAVMFKQFALDVNKNYDLELPKEYKKEEEPFTDAEADVKAGEGELDCSDIIRLFDNLKTMTDVEKDHLIKLDSVAGDGDLGLSMSDGFTSVQNYLKGKKFDDIGEIFYRAGKDMTVSAPSSLGTLMAFGFIGAGKALRGRSTITYQEIGDMLKAFEEAVMKLGGAKVGDKTFLDGFDPAVVTLSGADSAEAVKALLDKAAEEAAKGAEGTRNMLAKFGRIAFKGEAARGIIDPGSVFASLIIKTVAETFK